MDLIKQKHWFDSAEFEQKYHCDTPLGAFCAEDGSVIRLWAPMAEQVVLHLYEDGAEGEPIESALMVSDANGLWIYENEANLDGVYYDFDVTCGGVCRRTADPYARACGLNGKRSMVIDLSRTDPEGWMEDAAPAEEPDHVIYELHVKDFSWDPAGGFDAADRGKYSALCRTGTTLNRDGIHATGLDYLKDLGVTHIQLLPVYDYGSVDEGGSPDQFNWGYDPVNYNVPEGSYSSDPYHGEVRVRELKEAIQSLHRAGFRVIMDVVYNHTYELESNLWKVSPWYYYRQKEDGKFANGSGCGSEIASERSMCAKYILDSVLYWAEEYHMDGFRFDLMGLMDTDLLNNIQAALDLRFGAGEKLIYGEPWWAEPPAMRPGTIPCNKDNMVRLNPRIGSFCDSTRDAIKGNLMDVHSRGFVNGGGISAEKLYQCVCGWAAGHEAYYQAPSQTITYLSCHDDWTLWDKLIFSMDPSKRFNSLLPEVLQANRMAATINFCCQGHVFLLSGEEFGRTKGGVKNSYCASPEINKLDWARAWKNRELVEFYKGLIQLRMLVPAFQDKSPDASNRVVAAVNLAENCAGVSGSNLGGESPWDKVLLVCNGGDRPQEVPLPNGTWQLLVDDLSSFCWKVPNAHKDNVILPPMSALVYGRIEK